MQAILGVIFHFIGGSASGSFYIPYKKVRGWGWESYWIVGGIFSWLFIPFISAWLTVPGFIYVISNSDSGILFWTYFLGAMWGIGGLTFGLAMRYLGMSLGMSVALGFCSAFGVLIPPVYNDFVSGDTTAGLLHMFTHKGGLLNTILAGIAFIILSVVIVGYGNTL